MQRGVLVLLGLLVFGGDTALAQHSTVGGVSLRLLSHQALVRSARGGLLPPERTVALYGGELTVPTPWHALRLQGRFLRSTLGSSDLRSLDAGVVIGWRVLGAAAAFGQRGSYDPETGLVHGRDATFGRLGLRLRFGEPDARFILHLRGDTFVPIESVDDPADAIRGWDAESGVTWRARSLPFTASLGYRLERFEIFSTEQETSALTFAIGIALGGR